MLTPRFKADQNAEFVILTIDAPYVKFSDGEMVLQGNEFTFYCKPYFLKLYFSGQIVENGTEHAAYSIDSRQFTIRLPKINHGERFENLDMLTKLMAAKPPKSSLPLIEVISSAETGKNAANDNLSSAAPSLVAAEDDTSKTVSATLLIPELSSPSYGFNNNVSGLFTERLEERLELIDLPDPDLLSPSQRHELQYELEDSDFSSDHYLADLVEDEQIEEILRQPLLYPCGDVESSAAFTVLEQDALVSLPKKEYLLDPIQTRASLLGLVDILFANQYEMRTTAGEWSIESPWTIRKLSSLLSCLNTANSLHSVLVSCVRRSLCYPLYRHWSLSMKVVDDVRALLTMGKASVLKSLLHIHRLFKSTSDCYYILNDLYITDYCVWIQSVSENALTSLANSIDSLVLSKNDVALHLDDVEKQLLTDDSCSNDEGSISQSLDSDDDDECDDDTNNSRENDLSGVVGGNVDDVLLCGMSNITLNSS